MSIISVRKFIEFTSGTEQKCFIDGIEKKHIYKDVGAFKSKSADIIKRFQVNIAVPVNSESGLVDIDCPLIDPIEADHIRGLKGDYSLLHFSAILLSITRLFSSTGPIGGKMFIFDGRGTRMCTTIKDGFSFDLQKNARAHYLHCPDYMVSISDEGLQKSLKLRFEFNGVYLEKGSDAFYIDIGVMYRLLNNPDENMVREVVRESRFQELQACNKLPNLGSQISFEELKCFGSHNLEDLGDKQVIYHRKNAVGRNQRKISRMRRYHAKPIPDCFRSSQYKLDNNLDKFLGENSISRVPSETPKISIKLVKEWLERNGSKSHTGESDSEGVAKLPLGKYCGLNKCVASDPCRACTTDTGSTTEEGSYSGSLPEEPLWEHSHRGRLRQG
uniref:Movement protein n=1 Tax=Iranian poppy betaflexivirus TaxID=2933104 RepID=A0A9C7GX26_9VIRU|nr:putative movement protein [Iranian poppy betaflexivirus]CAI5383889.1 putative movement protein [Iranian poppy betaflexivirus]